MPPWACMVAPAYAWLITPLGSDVVVIVRGATIASDNELDAMLPLESVTVTTAV